jgi:hypothetical protein
VFGQILLHFAAHTCRYYLYPYLLYRCMCVCGVSYVSAATCMGRFRCILLRSKRVCLCVRVRVCGRVYIIDVCVCEVRRV